jgi:hypothetical protein
MISDISLSCEINPRIKMPHRIPLSIEVKRNAFRTCDDIHRRRIKSLPQAVCVTITVFSNPVETPLVKWALIPFLGDDPAQVEARQDTEIPERIVLAFIGQQLGCQTTLGTNGDPVFTAERDLHEADLCSLTVFTTDVKSLLRFTHITNSVIA